MPTSAVITRVGHAARGEVLVWRLEDFEPKALPKAAHGHFYRGDSYIVQHTTEAAGREHVMLYMWLGDHSTTDEKGACAVHATKMDDALGGKATQVRVEMGGEPLDFVALFEGGMVVHTGGAASGSSRPVAQQQ